MEFKYLINKTSALAVDGTSVGKNVIPPQVIALIKALVCKIQCKLPKALTGILSTADFLNVLRVLKITIEHCKCPPEGLGSLV